MAYQLPFIIFGGINTYIDTVKSGNIYFGSYVRDSDQFSSPRAAVVGSFQRMSKALMRYQYLLHCVFFVVAVTQYVWAGRQR